MATSYKLVLKANKVDAKGEMPLYIRVTANRKTSFFATGVKLLPELWDEDKEAVKKKHRNSQRLNHFLAEKLVEVQAKAIELENQGNESVSAKQVKQALRKPASSSFIEFFQNHLTWLERNGSVGGVVLFSRTVAKRQF